MNELKIGGKLLGPLSKLVDKVAGKAPYEQAKEPRFWSKHIFRRLKEEAMPMQDLYRDFEDWFSYNHPEVELGPLQKDLIRIALRHPRNKISKTVHKAIIKELANKIITAGEAKPQD